MKPSGNGYYPFPFRQGSTKDFAGAWLVRIVVVVLLGELAWSSHKTADDARDGKNGVIEIKATLPAMQRSISALEEQGKTFATKEQLEAAEMRVKNEFRRQIEEQTEAAKMQTGGVLKRGRP